MSKFFVYIVAILFMMQISLTIRTCSESTEEEIMPIGHRIYDMIYDQTIGADKTIVFCEVVTGNYAYVGGSCLHDGDWDAYICKIITTNPPSVVWHQTWDYNEDEALLGIDYSDGKIYAAGYSKDSSDKCKRIVLKLDASSGDVDKSKVYGDSINPELAHDLEYHDGYVYTIGSKKHDDGLYRVTIHKLTTNLGWEWGCYLNTFGGGPEFGYGFDMYDNKAYITGVCYYVGHSYQLYPIMIKFNCNTQNIVWSDEYGIAWWSQISEECIRVGNRVYAVGTDLGKFASTHVYMYYVRESDGWLDGSTDRWWGGENDNDYGADILEYEGNYYITGLTESYGSGGGDAFLLKVNSALSYQWHKTFGGSNDEEGSCIFNDDFRIYFAGYTKSYGQGTQNAFMAKYSHTGAKNWDFVWSASIDQPPTADAGGPYYADEGDTVYFDGSDSHDNDEGGSTIVRFDWKYYSGDDWHNDIGPYPTRSYGSAGDYELKLRVHDDEGNTDIDTTWVYVDEDCCFPAGTLITLYDGSQKSIEDIDVGDQILAESGLPWTICWLSSPIHPVYEINCYSGDFIQATCDHPIKIKKSDGTIGWGAIDPERAAQNTKFIDVLPLEIGDSLYTLDENWVEISSITFNPDYVQTYNILSVSGIRTYYANELLVYEEFPPSWDDKAAGIKQGMYITMYPETGPAAKKIEDIMIGDTVLAYNISNKLLIPATVVDIVVNREHLPANILKINNNLCLSPLHDIFINNERWMKAGEVCIRDKVLTIDPSEMEYSYVEIDDITEASILENSLYDLIIQQPIAETFNPDGYWADNILVRSTLN